MKHHHKRLKRTLGMVHKSKSSKKNGDVDAKNHLRAGPLLRPLGGDFCERKALLGPEHT
jgi:hypothetical protein